MRSLTKVLAVIAGLAVSAEGEEWRLIASCPTPGAAPRGYDGRGYGMGYVVQARTNPYAYYINTDSGSVYSSFPIPGGAGVWGISVASGGGFWVSDIRTSYIYAVTSAGSVVSSFVCPLTGPADLDYGLNGYLYVAIPQGNVIAVVNPITGSLVETYAGPGAHPTSNTECGIFVADDFTHSIYATGLPIITGVQKPTGLGWTCPIGDDWTIWLYVVDDATDRVYTYIGTDAVAPTSLGRVRALFR